ncbi:hypothetical protein ACI77I_31675 [Pseudomonas sp. D47]|uniref:GapS4a family protein n=1 Tax=Pseudomonas sp. D47 TaxID=3159447 RepID=UPI00387A9CF9
MGEWSKKLGERGEHVVETLLNLIGWKAALKGTSIDCVKPKLHSTTDNPRQTHGADFIFSCLSPLEDGVLKHLVISSKFSSVPYPTSPGTKFKEHFIDLATTVECFNRSTVKKSINSGYTDASSQAIAGVLFWLSAKSDAEADVVSQVTGSRKLDDSNYGTIYVIDNYRASFLFDTITYVRNTFGAENVSFLYPSTGKNVSPIQRLTNGPILPPEYLNSGLIPFFVQEYDKKHLVICCQDGFSEEVVKRMIGFSMAIALEFPHKVTLAFPDFNYVEHEEVANIAKLAIANKEFASIVDMESYQADFRG